MAVVEESMRSGLDFGYLVSVMWNWDENERGESVSIDERNEK